MAIKEERRLQLEYETQGRSFNDKGDLHIYRTRRTEPMERSLQKRESKILEIRRHEREELEGRGKVEGTA